MAAPSRLLLLRWPVAERLQTGHALAVNNGEKVLSGPAVEEFCRFYVHNFLHAHNVKDIEVTFNSRGALGSYIDYGTKQAININLQKLKKRILFLFYQNFLLQNVYYYYGYKL